MYLADSIRLSIRNFFIETPFACLNFSNKAVRLYPKDLHNESILTSLEILSSIYREISLTSFSSFFSVHCFSSEVKKTERIL